MALVSRPLGSIVSQTRAFPLIGLGVVIALLYWARVFFITFFTAVAIAFMLEPLVALLMRIRFPRSLASFVVCSFALALVYVIGLGAYSQLSGIYDELPKYGQRIADIVDGVQLRISGMEDQTYKILVPARQRPRSEAPLHLVDQLPVHRHAALRVELESKRRFGCVAHLHC